MKFKPFGKKYSFDKDILNKDFPSYFHTPLNNWLMKVLIREDILDKPYTDTYYLDKEFIAQLQVHLREVFPQDWRETIQFTLQDNNRTANILALCLQNYSNGYDAFELEAILLQGGSAYEVTKVEKDKDAHEIGVYDLVERVSPIIKEISTKALSENKQLEDVWNICYSRNPNYEKVVVDSQNFLEAFLRDKYEPSNKTPQLGKLIGNLKASPQKLKFKGSDVLKNKQDILLLIDNVANVRGMHTAGTGRNPLKEDAEYVLHTTIYIWNLHQK